MTYDEKALERLDAKSVPVPHSGCQLWMGYASPDGYGVVSYRSKLVRAHRLAYQLANGVDPGDLNVCHRCDTPLCINPGHLFLGTHEDNVADRQRKRRQAKGPRQGSAKLDARRVGEIKRWLERGAGDNETAQRYGVSPAAIWKIRRGVSWRHVA